MKKSEMKARIADLELALNYACVVMGQQEPPDSRAVSNEFVAMFSIYCNLGNQECCDILAAAVAKDDPLHMG